MPLTTHVFMSEWHLIIICIMDIYLYSEKYLSAIVRERWFTSLTLTRN